jgi:hypothetical protein
MADEIRIRAALSFAKSGKGAAADSGEKSVAMSGIDYWQGTQTVGTAEEPLNLGDVTPANAYYQIENLDATSRVDLKPAAGGTVTTQIGAGKSVVGQFGPSVVAPYVQSGGAAAAEIKVLIVEA